MVAFWTIFCNFVRIHKSLNMTPALATGVTERLMSTEDIAEMVEEYDAELPREKPGRRPRTAEVHLLRPRRHPYAWRTWLRQRMPWFLINLGIADKGNDCEAVGARHCWYNRDDQSSGCYHCHVVRAGRLWERESN